MTRGATLSANKVILWERLSASIIAAGKPLPQKMIQPIWENQAFAGCLFRQSRGFSGWRCNRSAEAKNSLENLWDSRHVRNDHLRRASCWEKRTGPGTKKRRGHEANDIGWVDSYPTVNVWFKVAPEGTALHSDAFREAANSDEAWKSAVLVAKSVALSAYEMLTKPEKLKAVQESFKAAKAKEGK